MTHWLADTRHGTVMVGSSTLPPAALSCPSCSPAHSGSPASKSSPQ